MVKKKNPANPRTRRSNGGLETRAAQVVDQTLSRCRRRASPTRSFRPATGTAQRNGGACVRARSRALVDTTAMRRLHEQAEAQNCQLRVQVVTDDRAVGTHMPVEDLALCAAEALSCTLFAIVLLRLPRFHHPAGVCGVLTRSCRQETW